jgi:hypothetical protein
MAVSFLDHAMCVEYRETRETTYSGYQRWLDMERAQLVQLGV